MVENRFKHLELDFFACSMLTIAVIFLVYTTFLKYSLFRKPKVAVSEEELQQGNAEK